MSLIFIFIGLLLCANGVILLLFSNINLGVIITAVLGVALILYGVLGKKLNTKTKIYKVAKIAFFVMLICGVILVSFIAIYGQNDNASYKEDAVIVLGAGINGDRITYPLKLRLDKAIEYYNKNPEVQIVVTGGQGFQETVTEAYAMEKYLVQNGVEASKIIKEEKATSTNENMRFSKKLLKEDSSIVVITNNFHIYRAVSIAKTEGFNNVTHIHAGLQWYNLVPCYIRECLAVLKMWVFD